MNGPNKSWMSPHFHRRWSWWCWGCIKAFVQYFRLMPRAHTTSKIVMLWMFSQSIPRGRYVVFGSYLNPWALKFIFGFPHCL